MALFSRIAGGLKSHLTVKLHKAGIKRNAFEFLGFINQEKIRLAEAKEILIRDFEFSPSARVVTELSQDKQGVIGYHDSDIRREAEDAAALELYRVPPGTKVNIDALKSWIKAKKLYVDGNIKNAEIKYRRETLAENPDPVKSNSWSIDEDTIKRLAYLIMKKFEREGYDMPLNNEHYEKPYGLDLDGEDETMRSMFDVEFEGKNIGWDKGQV